VGKGAQSAVPTFTFRALKVGTLRFAHPTMVRDVAMLTPPGS
jgi:hypothetical protein